MASTASQSSRLPVIPKARAGRPRRVVLGDITSQRNLPRAVEGKVRLARQASRRIAKEEKVEQPAAIVTNSCELPLGVEDIDARDAANPQLCSEYALEMFAYLRQREAASAVRAGHLEACPTTDRMRAVLVDWLVEVQVEFKLLQETLFSTVSIVDRYMAAEGAGVTRTRLQLVGVSAMFLAAKTEEVYAPAITDFVYITDNAYTEGDIKAMEIAILRVLNFDLFEPVSLHFLRRFSKAGDVDVLQHGFAKFAIEAALLDYELVAVEGSRLAAAGLLLALLLLEPRSAADMVWSTTLAFHSGYSRAQLLPTVARLAQLLTGLVTMRSKQQAIRTKYQGPKFHRVAERQELRGEVMTQLAAMKL